MSAVAQAAPAFTLPEIGQPFGGGFFTGITRDPDTGKRYLNITAGAAYELVGEWGKYGEKAEGADSFTNSRANTEAMAAAGSELAQKVLGLDIGGFTDWSIPARDSVDYYKSRSVFSKSAVLDMIAWSKKRAKVLSK